VLLIKKITKDLLLSLPVKKNKIDEYLADLQGRRWLSRALSSSSSASLVARLTKIERIHFARFQLTQRIARSIGGPLFRSVISHNT